MLNIKRRPKRVIIQESYWNPHPPKRWTWLIVLCGVITTISLLAFSQALLAAAQPGHGSGELMLSNKHSTQAAIQHHAKLNIDIQGMAAAVELQQVFENTSDDWVNGRYVFPLPDNAAVHFMQIRIGERTITSSIKERGQAKKVFEAAKAAGKKAALTQQHRPNIFSQNIANIGPKEKITITLKYSQAVRYNVGEFSLRFPMTITSRYSPSSTLVNDGTETISDNADIQTWYRHNTESGADNHNKIAINVLLNAGLPLAEISSPYHQLSVRKQAKGHQISTTNTTILMDRDFVLTWRATAASSPNAASFSETVNDDRYVKIILLPPAANPKQLPREVLFILDTSGSMGGPSIKQAKQSLLLALQRLKPHDFFNVYEFNSRYSQLFRHSLSANSNNLQAATQFVQKLHATGGTNMAEPLEAALQSPASENPVRQVVFITDGSVGNETQLFQLIDQHLNKARLFTVGIGAAPNSYFMRKAAEFGRGTYTHIASVNEVQSKMAALFKKLESPVLSDIALQWPNGTSAEVWPNKIPDLYAGEPLVLYAKLHSKTAQYIMASGLTADKSWQQQFTLPVTNNSHSGIISQGWARAKIASLLDQKITGIPEQTIREQVLAVALPHHLMSPYTSLIAVEETASKPSTITASDKHIPLVAPAGQNVNHLRYPQTATLAPLHILFAILSLLALMVYRGRYRDTL